MCRQVAASISAIEHPTPPQWPVAGKKHHNGTRRGALSTSTPDPLSGAAAVPTKHHNIFKVLCCTKISAMCEPKKFREDLDEAAQTLQFKTDQKAKLQARVNALAEQTIFSPTNSNCSSKDLLWRLKADVIGAHLHWKALAAKELAPMVNDHDEEGHHHHSITTGPAAPVLKKQTKKLMEHRKIVHKHIVNKKFTKSLLADYDYLFNQADLSTKKDNNEDDTANSSCNGSSEKHSHRPAHPREKKLYKWCREKVVEMGLWGCDPRVPAPGQ